MRQDRIIEKLEKVKGTNDIGVELFKPEELLEVMKTAPDIIYKRMQNLIEKKILRKYELSVPNLNILFVLLQLEKATQSVILDYIYTSAANLSQRVEFMISKGWIAILRNQPEDRRKKFLYLTPKGKRLTNKAIAETQKFKQGYSDRFSKQELVEYMHFHYKLVEILDELESS